MWVRTVFTDTNITCAISSVVSSPARWPRTSSSLGVRGSTTIGSPARLSGERAAPGARPDVVEPVVLLGQSGVGAQQAP